MPLGRSQAVLTGIRFINRHLGSVTQNLAFLSAFLYSPNLPQQAQDITMKLGIFTAILLAIGILPASAHSRHHHHYRHHHVDHMNPVVQGLGMGLAVMLDRAEAAKARREGTGWPNLVDVPPQGWPTQPAPVPFKRALGRVLEGIGQILPHPSGCPHTAFCGCGAASYLGISNRDLWLAANWFRFPRAQPGPGMAAVRQHHVMVIVSYEGGGVATVYDANSGRHLTRIHQVSLRGYEVVDPHGRRYARL